MKAFLSGHWEKLLCGLAFLLCAASATFHLLLAGTPVIVGDMEKATQDLDAAVEGVKTVPPPPRKDSQVLETALRATPGTFEIRDRVFFSAGAASVNTVAFVEGEARGIPLSDPCDASQVKSGDPASVRVDPVDRAPDGTWRSAKVTALKPGVVVVDFLLGSKKQETFQFEIAHKSRIELWPPVLAGVQPNPQEPGEVTVTWRDHPSTSTGATAGYLLERRPAGGEFAPVLGPGRMLRPSDRSYVDTVEPNRKYEYRILAIGSPSVTHVLPE